MAIKELFQDSRPQVLFDPRASQRIDPRFKFTRNGTASYYDKDGVLRYAPANQPRFNHDPVTGESLGLLVEEARTNLLKNSTLETSDWQLTNITRIPNAFQSPDGLLSAVKIATTTGTWQTFLAQGSIQGITPSPHTFSVFAKAGEASWICLAGIQYGEAIAYFNLSTGVVGTGSAHTITPLGNGWYRCSVTTNSASSTQWGVFPSNGDATLTPAPIGQGIYVWGAQLEAGSFSTSYIPTTSAAVTRPADLLSIEGTSLPATGSIYIDARSLSSSVDDTLLSAANASNDKLTLAIRQPASLYNSKALVYEVDGAFKPTLPFPVPTNARERNLITYGANNYHYRTDSSRLTPSSSSSVPANMNRLGIGHDITDPTKAFTGYINTVYLWPGEITPTVAEALVRGDLDPKDADAGVFTPEAGALAFVFNTQGTATDGNTVVQLPFLGSTNNVLVDWGDNTSSSFIGAAASSTVSHTYSAAGIYPVQITADDDGTNSGLQNLEFYNDSPADLVRVLQWGGSTTWNPTTMYRAFRDCTQMDFVTAARTNLPDTSAITNWQEAFYNCSSISGTFPTFNTSAATSFSNTWYGCSSLTAFPFIASGNVTDFKEAWRNCSSLTSFPEINTASGTSFAYAWWDCNSLTSFPLIDTAAGTNFNAAWFVCTSLTSFPLINTAAGTNFNGAWYNCSSLTSFPLIDTAAGTSFGQTWLACSSLTSFPLIDTAAGTNFSNAWFACTSLTSFPLINTAAGTDFSFTWYNCNSLTSFPLINTTSGTDFSFTWYNCSSLTSFPLINTAAGTDFNGAWQSCSSLTSFPLIDTAAGTNFQQAWQSCSSLTSFPLIDTAAGTNFFLAWYNCSSLTSFPLINTAAGTNFYQAWYNCSSLTSFPLIDTAAGTNFQQAWQSCSSLTSFPLIDTAAGTNFFLAWYNCSSLTSFPANFFDSWTGTPVSNCFVQAWDNCSSLTATSVENILNSINTSGRSAPASGKDITIDYNAGSGTPSVATAITNLKGRGWTITLNGVAQ